MTTKFQAHSFVVHTHTHTQTPARSLIQYMTLISRLNPLRYVWLNVLKYAFNV